MSPTSISIPSGDAPATPLVERVQDFVSKHRTVILIASAAAVTAAGIAYLHYSSTSSIEKGFNGNEEKKKKPSTRGTKKKKQDGKVDSPILEERKPKVEDGAVADFDSLSAEQVFALPESDRVKVAVSFKGKGNAAYQAKNFVEAAELYTKAIQVSPKPEPVFYSNRAACYMNMTPPQHELVVQDCTEAIKLDSKYVKALNRRALALESLGQYQEALIDITAATILDRFQNQNTASAVERVLKSLSTTKAKDILDKREPRLPSYTFISAYFAAFRPHAHPDLPETPSTGDQTLQLALSALDAADYPHAVTLVNEAIEQGVSWDIGQAESLNLRGTFKFLMGDVKGAKEDLEESLRIKPDFTQSLVKVASVYMEQGDPKSAFECFEKAIEANESDPDIYYHRGQVYFIMNEFKQAAENYVKSSDLDEEFVFSHIQLAVAHYKMGEVAKSMATFRRTLKKFHDKSEPYNYYGELLLDQRLFEEAVEKFDTAIDLEKRKSQNTRVPPNVLSYVNKGLALYQWKQDIHIAEECCREALKIDSECEAAVATIAQLSLQQGKIVEAAKMFERHAELARTEPELHNALTYQYATLSQAEFLKNYPDMAEELTQIAQNMTMMG